MRHFKWLLLKLAITEEIFVCSLTTLLKPDLLFPAEGGAMRGIAARWGGQLGVNIAAAIGFASGGGAMLGLE
ncbi:unnamed protein product, partial [Mesorhabditis belari]|uniref:Uncharacterized protein n=1 Tax=Mesorhabditis belari TaxID=2138241 RepID=A0AAF3EJL4_9BILA